MCSKRAFRKYDLITSIYNKNIIKEGIEGKYGTFLNITKALYNKPAELTLYAMMKAERFSSNTSYKSRMPAHFHHIALAILVRTVRQ